MPTPFPKKPLWESFLVADFNPPVRRQGRRSRSADIKWLAASTKLTIPSRDFCLAIVRANARGRAQTGVGVGAKFRITFGIRPTLSAATLQAVEVRSLADAKLTGLCRSLKPPGRFQKPQTGRFNAAKSSGLPSAKGSLGSDSSAPAVNTNENRNRNEIAGWEVAS